MYTMFDILQNQGEANVRAFGQQFGLSPDQTRRAMEALMPALTLGLQNPAGADPMGIGRMFGFGAPGVAAKPPGPADMLSGMFGSPMLAQAVIQQASAASGVGAQALRQMLPIMAGMIVAGIVHLMLNPPTAPAAEPAPTAPNFGNLWADWLNGLSAAASAAQAPSPAATRAAAPPPRPQLRQEPSSRPQPDAAQASMEVISQMLQTSAEVQERNVKAMREVFDAFWSQEASAVPGQEPAKPASAPAAAKPAVQNPSPAPSARRKPGTRA